MRDEERRLIEMDEFEQELQRALRRVDVRPETARKFLAIAAEDQSRKQSGRWLLWRPPAWRWAVVSAVLTLGIFGAQWRRQSEQQKAVEAQRQFEAGVRITDQTLEKTRAQLTKAGVRIGE